MYVCIQNTTEDQHCLLMWLILFKHLTIPFLDTPNILAMGIIWGFASLIWPDTAIFYRAFIACSTSACKKRESGLVPIH